MCDVADDVNVGCSGGADCFGKGKTACAASSTCLGVSVVEPGVVWLPGHVKLCRVVTQSTSSDWSTSMKIIQGWHILFLFPLCVMRAVGCPA